MRRIWTLEPSYHWRWRVYLPPQEKYEVHFVPQRRVGGNGLSYFHVTTREYPYEAMPLTGHILIDAQIRKDPSGKWTLTITTTSQDKLKDAHTIRFDIPASTTCVDEQVQQTSKRQRRKLRCTSPIYAQKPLDASCVLANGCPGTGRRTRSRNCDMAETDKIKFGPRFSLLAFLLASFLVGNLIALRRIGRERKHKSVQLAALQKTLAPLDTQAAPLPSLRARVTAMQKELAPIEVTNPKQAHVRTLPTAEHHRWRWLVYLPPEGGIQNPLPTELFGSFKRPRNR